MLNRLLTIFVLSSMVVGFNATAVNAEINEEACKRALHGAVDVATPGQPPRPIPRRFHNRVVNIIYGDIVDGVDNFDTAVNRNMGRLARIRNYWWRRDLARSAAAITTTFRPQSCKSE